MSMDGEQKRAVAAAGKLATDVMAASAKRRVLVRAVAPERVASGRALTSTTATVSPLLFRPPAHVYLDPLLLQDTL